MTEQTALHGYVGKILRINLTDGTTEIIPTSKYVPKYIGGRSLCHRIFWDEVQPGVGAFDPGNKLVFMTGPTCATGIPTGGRSEMTGISPTALPEQYSTGNVGGWIGAALKYAGYDGFILEGKAPEFTYVLIDDDKVSFLSADPMKGMFVHATQRWIYEQHGPEVHSMVIGPAGENLCRNATITTSSDNALSRAGFGAVFGAKNLKAIAIKGTGEVCPADIKKILELRANMGSFHVKPNPVEHRYHAGLLLNSCDVPDGFDTTLLACSPGCNSRCNRIMLDRPSPLLKQRVSRVEKCTSNIAYNFTYDFACGMNFFAQTKQNHQSIGKQVADPEPLDTTDPDLDLINNNYMGDKMDFWGPDFDRGNLMLGLCNDYGLDKWDVIIWYFTWIAMAKKEGLLDDLDFGMKPDAEDPEFVKHFLTIITYRQGIGDIFAEGMARAIRTLGKEKYGDSIYHGRYTHDGSKRLDLPVSLEAAWGHSSHWQGRGYEGSPKWLWLAHCIIAMSSSRDPMGSAHFHDVPENIRQYMNDPSHSELLIEKIIETDHHGELKDSLTSCDWQCPNMFWPSMEAEMFNAATGLDYTKEDLDEAAVRSKLMFRAILIRNFKRDREMEVSEVFPYMTYPDPFGETVEWDEWNDFVDMYYRQRGWDLATGWPTRSTWEKYGLADVADEMEKIGKLPPEGRTAYKRSKNPLEK